MNKEISRDVNVARSLVKAIAKDIALQVSHHIKTMYPQAVKASPSTFLISVQGCVQNEIMASLTHETQEQIVARLNCRKKFRAKEARLYFKLRKP